MYAVIFRAKMKGQDEAYVSMAQSMRYLAKDKYGCTEFVSVTEGSDEITISYWDTLEQIRAWKQDARHLAAQNLGKSAWYQSYHVQVTEVLREYESVGASETI